MLLRAASAFSLVNPHGDNLSPFGSSVLGVSSKAKIGNGFLVCASKGSDNRPLTGVVFEPFEEVKKELTLVPTLPHSSIARQKHSDECESAINEQINVEYNVSYVYHAMFAYFDRDNIALKGLAKFFEESSEEERDHAEKFMNYQNKRGGKVKLQSILMPLSEFDHDEKGDALYAMELALSLEKLTNEKLLNLHAFYMTNGENVPGSCITFCDSKDRKVASQNNDAQLTDFVESEFLTEQVEAIKKMSEYVAQLRRVGKGHAESGTLIRCSSMRKQELQHDGEAGLVVFDLLADLEDFLSGLLWC
ncbi:unnamed protein product [Camellia sinensis]